MAVAKKSNPIDAMNYEQALAELEGIIADLENETGGLEKSVTMFERGKSLLQHCQKLLDEAELKVRKLEEDGSLSSIEE